MTPEEIEETKREARAQWRARHGYPDPADVMAAFIALHEAATLEALYLDYAHTMLAMNRPVSDRRHFLHAALRFMTILKLAGAIQWEEILQKLLDGRDN